MKIVVKGEMCDLNAYIAKMNVNRYIGNKVKQEQTNLVSWIARDKPEMKYVHITTTYYCKNKMKDKDNICFAKKWICDGLVNAGVLPNDGWANVHGFTDLFEIDKEDPRTEIEIIEM